MNHNKFPQGFYRAQNFESIEPNIVQFGGVIREKMQQNRAANRDYSSCVPGQKRKLHEFVSLLIGFIRVKFLFDFGQIFAKKTRKSELQLLSHVGTCQEYGLTRFEVGEDPLRS